MVNSGDRLAAFVVLRAIAVNEELRNMLVLKGAYAAEALSQTQRSTRDIDLTTRFPEWSAVFPADPIESRRYLKSLFFKAVKQYIDTTEEWTLYTVSVKKSPETKRPHRFGWDGFSIKVTLLFRQKQQYVVEIDISSGDFTGGTVPLRISADDIMPVDNEADFTINSYTPEQLIAEKLRAFLQNLPPYLNKIGKNNCPPRVRDIWDIAVLWRKYGEKLSMASIASDFVEKCRRKSVDCDGPEDFKPFPEAVDQFRQSYNNDPELSSIPFEAAWQEMMTIVHAITEKYPPPGQFPLPVSIN